MIFKIIIIIIIIIMIIIIPYSVLLAFLIFVSNYCEISIKFLVLFYNNNNNNNNDNYYYYPGSPLALAVFSGALQIIIKKN